MRALPLAFTVLTLVLAGCSGGKEHSDVDPFTCPDGQVVTAEQIEEADGHHDAGFNASSLCPDAPMVVVEGLPQTISVYSKVPFTWEVDPGSVQKGHSMLMAIRYATSSGGDEPSVDAYPNEVVKKEHQDLPVQFAGNLTFNRAQTVYLRGYAQVQGEGYDRRDVWSEEFVVNVTGVVPTGTVATISKSPGLAAGNLQTDSESLQLGDAVQFTNQDLVEITLSQTSGPAGAPACAMTAGTGQTSDACVLEVPGTYTFETDELQPKSVTLTVAAPA